VYIHRFAGEHIHIYYISWRITLRMDEKASTPWQTEQIKCQYFGSRAFASHLPCLSLLLGTPLGILLPLLPFSPHHFPNPKPPRLLPFLYRSSEALWTRRRPIAALSARVPLWHAGFTAKGTPLPPESSSAPSFVGLILTVPTTGPCTPLSSSSRPLPFGELRPRDALADDALLSSDARCDSARLVVGVTFAVTRVGLPAYDKEPPPPSVSLPSFCHPPPSDSSPSCERDSSTAIENVPASSFSDLEIFSRSLDGEAPAEVMICPPCMEFSLLDLADDTELPTCFYDACDGGSCQRHVG
jgi:hypothetical protein